MVEPASIAPVLPAETNASERPSRWRARPTTRLEFGFLRTAWSGFSLIPMTSAASWISRRPRSTPG